MRETDSLSLKELETQVRQCEVMLVLIGEKWLFATDRHGRRLLDDPRDVVRNEIQIALENKLIVIPVLLGGAPFLETSALPEPIAKLSQIQAGKLSHEHWDEDFKVLRSAITDRGAQ